MKKPRCLWPWNKVVGFWSNRDVYCGYVWDVFCEQLSVDIILWSRRYSVSWGSVRSDSRQRRNFCWMLSGTNFLLPLTRSYSGQRGRSDRPAARQPRALQPYSEGWRCSEDLLTHHYKSTFVFYHDIHCYYAWDHGTKSWVHGSMGCIVVHP